MIAGWELHACEIHTNSDFLVYIYIASLTGPAVWLQVVQNLDTLVNLEELYLGKNKIAKLDGMSALTKLTLLSIQVWPV